MSSKIFFVNKSYRVKMSETFGTVANSTSYENQIELFKHWQEVVKECKTAIEEQEKQSPRKRPPIKSTNSAIRDDLKFAKMYNELIHSGRYTEKLIKLEFSYHPPVEDMFKTRDSSLDELQVKSTKEIETAINQLGQLHTEASISCLSSQHCQDMERLLNNWNKSIEALKDAQREDFCEKLESLYQDLLNYRDDSCNDSRSNKFGKTYHHSKNDKMKKELSISEDNPLFSIEDLTLEATVSPNHLEESFTINLGSQLKTAHNLRIMAIDSLYLCDTKRNRSCQMRTQTAMSLYSHNLSALVLLVDNHFESYFGVQYEFGQLCNSLNELHFDSFCKQIKNIQDHVMPAYAGRRNLETGDCYITRHSNLANVHIVFHLVTDDSLKTCEVNSRHPILASIRNILRVVHMYDIKTVSIPLLLVDEMNEEILTVNWCLKRAELVLKCVKGFLIEMASLSTGVEQGTIQFLVPKGISEELFTSLALLIPEIFRLANSLTLKSSSP